MAEWKRPCSQQINESEVKGVYRVKGNRIVYQYILSRWRQIYWAFSHSVSRFFLGWPSNMVWGAGLQAHQRHSDSAECSGPSLPTDLPKNEKCTILGNPNLILILSVQMKPFEACVMAQVTVLWLLRQAPTFQFSFDALPAFCCPWL